RDLGIQGAGVYNSASEPTAGGTLDYKRAGGAVGGTWDFAPLWRISADLRLEWVTAPDAGDPALPGSRIAPGTSHLATLAVGFEHDTRPDPILPYDGHRFAIQLEGGAFDYQASRAVASYGAWTLLGERHVLGVGVAAGIILGDPARFDQFYVGDINPLMAPRPLDLIVSTRGSFDVFKTGANQVSYGDVYAGGAVEYAY